MQKLKFAIPFFKKYKYSGSFSNNICLAFYEYSIRRLKKAQINERINGEKKDVCIAVFYFVQALHIPLVYLTDS